MPASSLSNPSPTTRVQGALRCVVGGLESLAGVKEAVTPVVQRPTVAASIRREGASATRAARTRRTPRTDARHKCMITALRPRTDDGRLRTCSRTARRSEFSLQMASDVSSVIRMMRPGERLVPRSEAHAWCPRWSPADSQDVRAAVDASPAESYIYQPASGAYIAIRYVFRWPEGDDTRWGRGVVIRRSTIHWHDVHHIPRSPKIRSRLLESRDRFDRLVPWLPLSGYPGPGSTGRARRTRGTLETCPECFLALPVSGVCATC